MALALDESKDSDEVIEEGGFTFCIDKELLARVRKVFITFTSMGFTVDTEQPLPGTTDGGNCGSGSSRGYH